MRNLVLKGLLICAAGVLTSLPASASLINFEDRPAGPSVFTGLEQDLTYNIGGITVTFAGGQILTGESNQTTDNSNVYATESTGNLTNPLVVTFSQAITNFQIDILNAIAGSYTLADNAGHSTNFSLATTGGSLATEGFAATGTQVTIFFNGPAFGGGVNWDFAIDNVTFNQPLGPPTTVPEPSSLYMLGTGVFAAACGLRRKLGF